MVWLCCSVTRGRRAWHFHGGISVPALTEVAVCQSSSDSWCFSGLLVLSHWQGEGSYWATIIIEKHFKMSSFDAFSEYALKGRNKCPLKFHFFPFTCYSWSIYQPRKLLLSSFSPLTTSDPSFGFGIPKKVIKWFHNPRNF